MSTPSIGWMNLPKGLDLRVDSEMNLKLYGQARAVGVNIDTSGVRAVAVNSEGRPVAVSEYTFKRTGDARSLPSGRLMWSSVRSLYEEPAFFGAER